MALAIFGSATSTSLMSRGRSITTDLPMPSARKRAFICPPPPIGIAPWSLATTGAKAELSVNAVTAENDRARTIVVQIERRFPLLFISGALRSLLYRRKARNAVANHIDAAATLGGLLLRPGLRRVEVRDAAKRQR